MVAALMLLYFLTVVAFCLDALQTIELVTNTEDNVEERNPIIKRYPYPGFIIGYFAFWAVFLGLLLVLAIQAGGFWHWAMGGVLAVVLGVQFWAIANNHKLGVRI